MRSFRIGGIRCAPRLLAAATDRQIAGLIVPWNPRSIELLPLLVVAKLSRKWVVLWGKGPETGRSRLVDEVLRAQARLAGAIAIYSNSGKERVARLGASTPLVVVENTTGRPAPADTDLATRVLRRVAFVGRLTERKRIDVLIDAIDRCRRNGLFLELELIGDGPLRPELQAQVSKAGLGAAVRWAGPIDDWGELKNHLSRSDMVVIPGAPGLAVVDAFAAARPVVVPLPSSDDGPEAGNVVHGENGWRYGTRGEEDLANLLLHLYGDEAQLIEAGRAAAEFYRIRLDLGLASARMTAAIELAGSELESSAGAGRTASPQEQP